MKLIATLTFLFLLASCRKTPTFKTGLEGKELPKFSMLLIDSVSHLDTKDIPKGEPVALFYFSPFCPYCRAETSEILESIDKLKGIRIYMITNYPFADMKRYYQEYKLASYPNITMAYDPQYFFINYFKAAGVPFMAIYGKDKKLNGAYMGIVKSSDIRDLAKED
jgi:thiol-disulfide isomerase/thioredoxin